jgi:YVTN family beta-propeller protein
VSATPRRATARRTAPRTLTLLLATVLTGAVGGAAAAVEGPPVTDEVRSVMFVGDNHDGTVTLVDATTFEVLRTIDNIPDHDERVAEITADPVALGFFLAIRELVGQGNDQFTDDVFTSHDGTEIYVSRPSFADVVAISLETEQLLWRYPMDGYRSDHMAISPDGTRLLVSDSTANIVHEIDTATGERTGTFDSGDSPHENEFFDEGRRILHASIGRVYTPFDRAELGEVRDFAKGEEVFQVVDATDLEILERWDIAERLEAYGRDDLSGAVRPMAIHPDERRVFFQVSFFHGYVEFDLEAGEVVDVVELPISDEAAATPREQYLLDSAHHGLGIDPAGRTLCVAGTMDDYAALVDVATKEATLVSAGSKPYWSTTGPTGEHCWVSYSGDDQVVVIDYASGQELARVDVGDHPQRVRAGVVREDLLVDDAAAGEPADRDGPAEDAAPPEAASGPSGPEAAVVAAPATRALPVTGGGAMLLAGALTLLAATVLRRGGRPRPASAQADAGPSSWRRGSRRAPGASVGTTGSRGGDGRMRS